MNHDNLVEIDSKPSIIHSAKKIGLEIKNPIIAITKSDDVPRILCNLERLIQD